MFGVSLAVVRCLVVEKRVSVALVFGYLPFIFTARYGWQVPIRIVSFDL